MRIFILVESYGDGAGVSARAIQNPKKAEALFDAVVKEQGEGWEVEKEVNSFKEPICTARDNFDSCVKLFPTNVDKEEVS